MTVAEFIDLYEYNRWAHERTLESASQVSPVDYARETGGSFPSLRATLEHMLAAEVVWLSRWEGHSLGDRPDYGGCSDASELRSIWLSFWKRQFAFLNSLRDDDLIQPVSIRTRTGIETVQSLSDTMTHVVNHSSYHRGQAAGQLRLLGGVPQSTDYFIYCYSVERTGETEASV